MINNTYAIIKSGGKQIKTEIGQAIWIEKIDDEIDKVISFKEIIALSNNGKISLGAPLIEGAEVKAVVQKHGKGPKLIIFRTKAKSNWSRKQGHRQPYTRLLVEQILENGKIISKIDDSKPKIALDKVNKPAKVEKPVEIAKQIEVKKPAKVVEKEPIKTKISNLELTEINDEQVNSKMKILQEKVAKSKASDLKLVDIKGVGKKTLDYLNEHNIKTIGDLVDLDKNMRKEIIAGFPGLNAENIEVKKEKFINFLKQAHKLINENNK